MFRGLSRNSKRRAFPHKGAELLPTRLNRLFRIPNRYPFTDTDGNHDGPPQLLQYIQGPADLLSTSIAGTETVTSKEGTATVTVSAGKLSVGSGTLWSFALSNGSQYEYGLISDDVTGAIPDVSGNDRPLVFVAADTSLVCKSGREFGSNYASLYGYTVGDETQFIDQYWLRVPKAGQIIPALLDKSGCPTWSGNDPIPPTAYFNGVFTPAQIAAEGGAYTGGPTVFADNLGVLQTAPSGVPALQGMRLATTVADGALFGIDRVINGDFTAPGVVIPWQPHTATYATITNANGVGVLTRTGIGSPVSGIVQELNLSVGRTYLLSGKLRKTSGVGSVSLNIINNDQSAFVLNNSVSDPITSPIFVSKSYLFVATQTNNKVYIRSDQLDTNAEFDEISIREVIPTYYDTALDGTPLLPSVQQPTRTFDAGFTTSVPGPIYKKYTRTNPAVDLPGYLCEPARTNYALNSAVPATHTTGTVPVGTYILWQEGTGSIAATAGTAVGTFGSASNGTPATITITTAGTVVLTPSGTNTWVQLESGPFKTSRILTTSAAAVRQGTVLSSPTAGQIRSNNMAFLQTVVPRASGQSGVYLFGNYTDANNYTAVIVDATTITYRKRIAGVNTDATVSVTHAKDTPLQILRVGTSTGMQIADRTYSGGAWSAWTNGTLNSSDGAKANAIIGVNYQLGALNSASQFTGNLSELNTRLVPNGISDPLSWAKQQFGGA